MTHPTHEQRIAACKAYADEYFKQNPQEQAELRRERLERKLRHDREWVAWRVAQEVDRMMESRVLRDLQSPPWVPPTTRRAR